MFTKTCETYQVGSVLSPAQTRKQDILTCHREELDFAVASMESGSDQTGLVMAKNEIENDKKCRDMATADAEA